MVLVNKLMLPGCAFLLTLAFGFWLSHTGKPYNGLLFNVHKLIARGGVVLAILYVTKIPNLLTSFSLVAVGLGLAAFSAIALFVNGALRSAGKLDYALMLTIHRVAPVVLGIALVWSGFLQVKLQ